MNYNEYNKKNLETYIENNNLNWVIIESYEGHISNSGCKSGTKNINPYCVVIDVDYGNEFIVMHINNNCYTLLDINDIHNIKNSNTSWFLCNNGYVASNISLKQIYLHQYIMEFWGQGKGGLSIDHINRNKLDNRRENLRITDQSIQNFNKDKVSRKYNAQELPNGITHDMIPKYVYYCSEIMNKNTEKEYTREYFRIEKHPKLTKKCISSSKSVNIGILEKLQEIIHKLENLNNDIVEPNKKYPKYITVKSSKRTKGKVEIIFDRRYQGKRQGLKKTINDTDDPWDFMELFGQSIMDKYDYNINQSP